jgi:hypothetical protein
MKTEISVGEANNRKRSTLKRKTVRKCDDLEQSPPQIVEDKEPNYSFVVITEPTVDNIPSNNNNDHH